MNTDSTTTKLGAPFMTRPLRGMIGFIRAKLEPPSYPHANNIVISTEAAKPRSGETRFSTTIRLGQTTQHQLTAEPTQTPSPESLPSTAHPRHDASSKPP
jgi:hypothetical protein